MKSSAIAHSNIALIKYWGRSPDHPSALNIPLNDTVSMTKHGLTPGTHLQTHTTIDFSGDYEEDVAVVEGKELLGRDMERVLSVVDPLRKLANVKYKFRMVSKNDFPTQAGLASSASGFAALAIATVDALGLELSKEEVSTYARLGSGSAARSIHGGFVYWNKGNSHETSYAEQICPPDQFSIKGVIALVQEGKKEVTSDVGHGLARTSPFNEVRVKRSQEQAREIKKAILDGDFSKFGRIVEDNCKYMHAVMMTSDPPLFYWQPATLGVIKSIQKIRKEGLECYFTIDAGPSVHTLCRPEGVDEVQKRLEKVGGVDKTILIEPAGDSYITKDHLF